MQAVAVSEIFDKLEKRPLVQACVSLLEISRSRFQRGMPVLANFLYYANADMRHLFDARLQTAEDARFISTLLEGDALFPDGIALALSYSRYARPEISAFKTFTSYRSMGDAALPNLNGTDLLPKLLSDFASEFWPEATAYLYGAREEVVSKAAEEISRMTGMRVGFQNGYSVFDFPEFENFANGPKILLVGLGTPRQEFWTNDNAGRLGTTLAVTVWGFFDFLWGGEKRAPKIVRDLRLEWLWRVALNPSKNWKKALASLRFFPRFYKGFR